MVRFKLVLICCLLIMPMLPAESRGQEIKEMHVDSLDMPFLKPLQEDSLGSFSTPLNLDSNCRKLNTIGVIGTSLDLLDGAKNNELYTAIRAGLCLWSRKENDRRWGIEFGIVQDRSFSSSIEPYTYPVFLREDYKAIMKTTER